MGTGMRAAPNAASRVRIMPGDVGVGCRECTAMEISVLLEGMDRRMEALQLDLAPHGWLRPANHHWETRGLRGLLGGIGERGQH